MIQIYIIAVMLIVLDAFVFGSFYVAGILLLIVMPIKIFKAIRLKADRLVFKQQFLSAGAYAITAIFIIAAFALNNDLARRRLTTITMACEQYKQKYGEYPAELPKLMPEFIDKIHAPKIGLFTSGFRYIADKDRHSIIYVKLPPFGRPYYTLETKQWGYMD